MNSIANMHLLSLCLCVSDSGILTIISGFLSGFLRYCCICYVIYDQSDLWYYCCKELWLADCSGDSIVIMCFKVIIYFWVHWVFICPLGAFLWLHGAGTALHSRCTGSVPGSQVLDVGFRSCGPRAVCLGYVGSSQTGIKTHVPLVAGGS